MIVARPVEVSTDPEARNFYRDVLKTLSRKKVPHLLGGAYAFQSYTGIARHTKDLDIFLDPKDVDTTLEVLARAGFAAEIAFPHWLAKVRKGEYFVDLIFNSGNGVARVDEDWFRKAVPARFLDIPVRLCPPEEMIWSKAFIQERERFDGADILHLVKAVSPGLDWHRLMDRFGRDWRVLLSHLVLFGYVYPGERDLVPSFVMGELLSRLRSETTLVNHAPHVCRGPLLSRAQYLPDIDQGYEDPRLVPDGSMTSEDLEAWTKGIQVDGPEAPCKPPLS